jgi:hypothetical protein
MAAREATSGGDRVVLVSAPGSSLGERLARFFLTRSPLGALVRWVARVPASIHVKLLYGFLLVVPPVLRDGRDEPQDHLADVAPQPLLDEAHKRVDASRHIEHALAMQMNFTAMALLLKDETTIKKILRENNRFNSTLAQIEQARRRRSGT